MTLIRHRSKRRRDDLGPARTPDERRLELLQSQITRRERDLAQLQSQRDALALSLWLDERMTQGEITDRLDRADRRAGGPGMSYARVQKKLWRARDQLVAAAS